MQSIARIGGRKHGWKEINHLLRLLPLLVYHVGALTDTEELPFRKSILLEYKHAYLVVHFNKPFLYCTTCKMQCCGSGSESGSGTTRSTCFWPPGSGSGSISQRYGSGSGSGSDSDPTFTNQK